MAGRSLFAATLLLTTFVHWTKAQGCSVNNAVLVSNQVYTLTSINFPSPYPSTTSYYCTFTGTAPAGHKVFLYCDSFDVLYSSQCNLVWLAFSPSGNAQFTDSIRYCGYYQTLSLQTTGNQFAAAFVNDYYLGANPYTGYRCYVVAIPNTPTTASSTTTAPTTTTKAPTTSTTTTKAPTTSSSTTSSTTKAPSTCTCGIKNSGSRIVGGQVTTVHEYPWMVALVGKTTGTAYCGGTLIDNQWVLTATHCLKDFQASDIVVRLGEHQVSSTSETSHTISRDVAQIIVHANYNDVTVDNDIGLVKLSSPVIYSNQISPACLPLRFPTTQDFHGKMATVTGWGTTAYQGFVSDILQEITLPVIGNTQCNTFASVTGKLTSNMICTYEAGKDSCQGDSGGPLVYEEAGRNYLIGVVSWGIKCAENGNPGVYAKVNNYLDWIKQKTGVTFCNV